MSNNLLGYFYSIQGEVISGEGLGKKINFPTANLKVLDINKLIPGNGVYFIRAYFEEKLFYGMCNIGFNPTVTNLKKLSIEVHLFDFNANIYKKRIIVEFIDFIREEKHFKNINFLKKQLENDKNKCLEYSINNV